MEANTREGKKLGLGEQGSIIGLKFCDVSCDVTLVSIDFGVTPRGETDLNDTRAIELGLGCSLLAGDEVWSRGRRLSPLLQHPRRSSLLIRF
jgi:hypothetical protein